MKHLLLLLYSVSFLTGCISISLALFIARLRERKTAALYAFFLGSLALILLALIISLYLDITTPPAEDTIRILTVLIDFLGVGTFIVIAPVFFRELLGLTPPPGWLPRLLGSAFTVMAVSAFFLGFPLYLSIPALSMMYGVYVYSLLLCSAHYRRLGSRTLRWTVAGFLLLSLAFLPLILLESFRPSIPGFRNFAAFELFSLPAYFLILNVASIFLSTRYFNQPPYSREGVLTDHFRLEYGITGRESEIIALVIRGDSYRDIADTLFISSKTVDNHLRNIYRKTGVKNRLQLLNLIDTNSR